MATPPTPSKVRESILSQHDQLRSLLRSTDALAERVALGDPDAMSALRAEAQELLESFELHLDFEDRYLVPALREIDAWGPERARRVESEHHDQRVLLKLVLAGLDAPDRDDVRIANQMRGFVATVRDDMIHEERSVLSEDLLRDDPVGIAVEAG